MKWKYKNIEIGVDGNGKFIFDFSGEHYSYDSLYEAKANIDSLTESYYKITEKDIDSILKKLDKREGEFVSYMIEELHSHMCSNYCAGVEGDWDF